jgi:hypothetical protein
VKKDLIILVPDKNTKYVLDGLLPRYHALGIRPICYDIYIHPQRNPGIYNFAFNFLLPFHAQYSYSLVFCDKEGSGQDKKTSEEIAHEIKSKFDLTKWENRVEIIVFNPELEILAWVDSPHLAANLEWSTFLSLQKFVQQQGFWKHQSLKPNRPKEAIEIALKEKKIPRSSAIYKKIAEEVSFKNCQEESFIKFKYILKLWFAKE